MKQILLFLSFFNNHTGEITPTTAYKKLTNKYCSRKHGSFGTLVKAQADCKTDTNCYGVYDPRCDNLGSFSLCDLNNKAVYTSRVGSCIYEKGIIKIAHVLFSNIAYLIFFKFNDNHV